MEFVLNSKFKPTGDQPEAIEKIVDSIKKGNKEIILKGVTGSGKTFTMANIIEKVQKPTLVIAHNKTLAYQLASEFKEFFPNNAVEFFVSYYDYYQPEAYVPQSDTYIEKDSSINDEIDKLRHSATMSLFERRDVIIVASVSCIYGLGDPIDYEELVVSLRPGMIKDRDEVIRKLVDIQYVRNDINFIRGTFRVRGDSLEIFPVSSSENSIRVEFFGDEIDKISEIDALTGNVIGTREHVAIYPASHFATSSEKIERAIGTISQELEERLEVLNKENKFTNVWTETNRKKEILRNTIKQSQKLYNSILSEKQLKLDLVINSERVNLSKKLIDTLAELAEKEAERQKLLSEYEKLLLKKEGFVNKIEIEEMFRDRKKEDLKRMNRKV